MSRCFSYPPPGYSGNEGSGQALIESIKLQRERELAKAESKKERKREKKEKKERRKEKKGKSKSSLLLEKKIHKSSSTPLKSKSLQQLLLTETEQLERSSLTEEHAQPAGELKPSTSSESTQNSSKRKRESSPPAGAKQEENSLRSNGNVIRIRLSSQKQNHVVKQEPCSTSSERTVSPLQKQAAVISRQEPCSTSGRTELGACNKCEGQVDVSSVQQRSNNVAVICPPKPETEVCSTSVPISVTRNENAACISQLPEAVLPPGPHSKVRSTSEGPKSVGFEDDIAVRDPKSLSKKLVKAELRYRDLFLSWVPPPQTELECDDQDWLFSKKKNPDNRSEIMPKPITNVSCGSSSSSLWPRAQFIPEADIYALPFTVPF